MQTNYFDMETRRWLVAVVTKRHLPPKPDPRAVELRSLLVYRAAGEAPVQMLHVEPFSAEKGGWSDAKHPGKEHNTDADAESERRDAASLETEPAPPEPDPEPEPPAVEAPFNPTELTVDEIEEQLDTLVTTRVEEAGEAWNASSALALIDELREVAKLELAGKRRSTATKAIDAAVTALAPEGIGALRATLDEEE